MLLETLEKSACNPEIASILLKSLLRILQLAVEQSLASFKSLDAIARVLKVACIQAQELRKIKNMDYHVEDDINGVQSEQSNQMVCIVQPAVCWVKCMESSFELFTEYLLLAENGRSLVLHNSSCIDSLFDLFWEENLRKRVLEQILGLLKVLG